MLTFVISTLLTLINDILKTMLILEKMIDIRNFLTYQPPYPQSWGNKLFLVIRKLLTMRVISYITKI